MLGRTRRTSRELRDATTLIGRLREDLKSSRTHLELVEADRDMWQRRAIEYADRLVNTEGELRRRNREYGDLNNRVRRQEDTLQLLQMANENHYRATRGTSEGAEPADETPAAAA